MSISERQAACYQGSEKWPAQGDRGVKLRGEGKKVADAVIMKPNG